MNMAPTQFRGRLTLNCLMCYGVHMTTNEAKMIFERTFGAGDVTRFAAVTNANLQNWVKRGVIVGQHDITGGGGNGLRRRYSWFNMMEIAVAAELMECAYLGPSDAFKAAMSFSHSGHGPVPNGLLKDALMDDEPERHPAVPYHYSHGATYLFVWKGGQTVHLSADGVVNLNTIAPSRDNATGFIVINVSEIFQRVIHRMGLDWRTVLDAAYSGKEG